MGLYLYHAESALKAMELSSFEFHLTGSRFFCKANANSDWDFFVEDQPKLADWLYANGFRWESRGRDYSATAIIQIWRHGSEPIHIQIVEDASRKLDVQFALLSSCEVPLLYALPKDQRKELWNLAFHLFDQGERSRRVA